MADSDTDQSPLQTAAGAAHPQVVNAFKLLGDETRLAILLALWDSYDPYRSNEAVSFSELYNRVGVPDSANLTYHLNKLSEHFVEKTNNGYHLRNAGLILVRTVIAGAGLEKPSTSSSKLDLLCTRCGKAQMEISYRDSAIYLTCSECVGFTASDEYPSGTIAVFEFEPAGLANRRPSELLAAGVIRSRNNRRMMMGGVCPTCSGTIDASLRLCERHNPGTGEVCSNCGTLDSARVRYVCTVCKQKDSRPVELTISEHPAVISFFDDHGIHVRWTIDDLEGIVRGSEVLWAMEHTIMSMDPVRIRVTVPCEGEELHLTLDENRDVIDIHGN